MRKMRKFNDGGSADAEEAKYKAAGLAASNAENKSSSGFFGRLGEGNIDQKGSVAYEKYGAGYGRKLEAEKAAKASEAAAPAPTAKAPEAAAPDKSYDALESKRLSSPASKPDETPDKSYDALESKRLSSPTPAPRDNKPGENAMAQKAATAPLGPSDTADMKRVGSSFGKPPAAAKPAAKTAPAKPAAKTAPAKPAAKTAPAKPAAKTAPAKPAPATQPKMERRNLSVPNAAEPKMERRNLSVPNVAGPRSAANPMSTDSSQRSKPVDETKLSLSDRMKLSRERAKSSSTGTDTRPVGQRIREQFGMKKGGEVKGYASGGSVSSRADGIAQRGKTRGRMC